MLALLAIPVGCVFVAVLVRPAFGAYLLLFATPLIAGVARGSIPLRPNEMLLLVVMVALGVRILLLMLSRRYHPPRFDRMDWALLLLATTGSVVPILWRSVRSLPLSADDLLYSFVLIKYYALFRVFRATIVTVSQVTVCLWLSMTSAVLVAVVAMLQVLNLFGVPEFLLTYYDLPYNTPTIMIDRGTSTLASAFGQADLMIMNLIIALMLCLTVRSRRLMLLPASVVFLCGCMVSGEFSAYIGLVAAVIAFTLLFGSTVRWILPMLSGAGAIIVTSFWPVIARRLDSFGGQQGLPSSWDVRWDNLQRFFLPRVFSGINWLLGVRPAPRVPAPEVWREFVYIESGYLWLLWIGGVPFVIAFAYFAYTSLGTLRRIALARTDAIAAAAAAGFCYLVALLVLMLFDPHLTLRGSADLFFPLLALSLVRSPVAVRQREHPALRSIITPRRSPAAYPSSARGGTIAASD
jgi:hypothetical protein